MTKLIVYRENDNNFKMHCYINGKDIGLIASGESLQVEGTWEAVDFRCWLSGYLKSDVYHIVTAGEQSIYINIKLGFLKPHVTVKNGSAIKAGGEFVPTKTVKGYFGVNDLTRQFAIGKGFFPSLKKGAVYSYDDLVDFELLEDGTSVIKGGLGRAAVGGLLFGGVGAVVGGVTGKKKASQKCTSLMVKLTLKDTNHPVEYVKLIESETDKNSFIYQGQFENAQEILSLLQLICTQRAAQVDLPNRGAAKSNVSEADELWKFKALLDDGIITQEEFEAKKKLLLGL